MNCSQARDRLPGLLYGDLPAAEAAAVEDHLAGCPACRNEHAALRGVRRALDALPAPPVEVDLPRLYRAEADRRARQLRRWRRAAVALAGAAAVLLLVVGLRLELRVEAHQLVVRWGTPPPAPPPVARAEARPDRATQEQVQLLGELVHALAGDLEARDQRQRGELRRLQAQLERLRWQSEQRWAATEDNVSALYTAHFGPRE